MKIIKSKHFITTISVCAFSLLLSIFLLDFTKTSYAIETGTFTNGFPTSTFSTNLERGNTTTSNYVRQAFGSDTSYANFMNNFEVHVNYYDNNTNPLYVLMKNLEIPTATESFELNADSVKNVEDKGITYIINHGFNNTNSINTVFNQFASANDNLDNAAKYYITQVTLWLYIYDNKTKFSSTYCKNTGAGYSACDFLDNSNNVVEVNTIKTMLNRAVESFDGKYVKYIVKLLADAESYQGNQESAIANFNTNFNYSYTSDRTMIYIYNLVPNITGNRENYMYYAVEVEDPNSYGVFIADKNDN